MRILQIHTRYREAGGEDRVADAEHALLRQASHEVLAIRAQNGKGRLRATSQLASYASPLASSALIRVVKDWSPDLVHVHNTWFAVPPMTLKRVRQMGVPVVVTLHNYRLLCPNAVALRDGRSCFLCADTLPWHAVRYRCYQGSRASSAAAATALQLHRAMRTWKTSVDRFLVPSQALWERLTEAGIPPDKVRIKRNFVNDPGPRAVRPSECSKVLFIGRLSNEKGLDILLSAWKQAAPSGLELVIVGDGPDREQLMQRAPASVVFTGRLIPDEVSRLLKQSRAVLLPSQSNETGGPLVALEAFAAGIPVLGSCIAGITETIKPLGERWSVKSPNEPDAWARALEVLRESETVDAGGELARRRFDSRFSSRTALKELETNYAEVLSAAV